VLRENIRRHPDAPRGYELLARFLNQVGRPGEAMWYLQSIRRRDPDNMSVLVNICQQHWQLWDLPSATSCQEQYLARNPDDLDAQKWLAVFRADFEEYVRIAEREVAEKPKVWYSKMQLSEGLSRLARWERIIEVVASAFPDLMGTEPKINDYTQWGARRLAEALLKTGQTEQGLLLIDSSLEWFERSRKLQAGGWMAGTEDALLYALKGENERALDTLERAVNRDWMFFARSVLFDSAMNDLRDNPRYLALIDRLEQNMARERQWFEENKDRLQL
jgi:tetratricopeptide (TPR) repeat protein